MHPEQPTPIWPSSPQAELELWLSGLLPAADSANPALPTRLLRCVRHRGDWLAIVLAPNALRLYLLPGGGTLWGDIPDGQTRYLTLGGHDWKFVALTIESIGACQYCELLPTTESLRNVDEALLIADDALGLIGATALPVPAASPQSVDRRSFLGLFAGRRS